MTVHDSCTASASSTPTDDFTLYDPHHVTSKHGVWCNGTTVYLAQKGSVTHIAYQGKIHSIMPDTIHIMDTYTSVSDARAKLLALL